MSRFWKAYVQIRGPKIVLFPGTFESGENRIVDFNTYVNVFVHELIHALNSNSDNEKRLSSASDLRSTLIEGITQNIAFEVIQYLGTSNDRLQPLVSSLGDYDIKLLVASIIESVLRATGSDTLTKWHQVMKSDEDMLEDLSMALAKLNLDPSISSDIERLNHPETYRNSSKDPFEQILLSMINKFELKGVDLSAEFLKAIITKNRRLDDWQIKKLEETLKSITKEDVRH